MSDIDKILDDCLKYGEEPQTHNYKMTVNAIQELSELRNTLKAMVKEAKLQDAFCDEIGLAILQSASNLVNG